MKFKSQFAETVHYTSIVLTAFSVLIGTVVIAVSLFAALVVFALVPMVNHINIKRNCGEDYE